MRKSSRQTPGSPSESKRIAISPRNHPCTPIGNVHSAQKFKQQGEVFHQLGDLVKAKRATLRSIGLYKRLLDHTKDLVCMLELGSAFRLQGDIEYDSGRLSKALNSYQLSLDICSEVISDKYAPTWASADLACCWSRLGDAERGVGNLDYSLSCHETAYEMCQSIVRYCTKDEASGDAIRMIVAILKYAEAHIVKGDHIKAQSLLKINEPIHKHLDDSSLEIYYGLLANIYNLNKQYRKSSSCLLKSHRLSYKSYKRHRRHIKFTFNYLVSIETVLKQNIWGKKTAFKYFKIANELARKILKTTYRTSKVKSIMRGLGSGLS